MRQVRTILVVGLALLTMAACGPKRHAAVVADTALFEALNATHKLEQMALCGAPTCAGVTLRVTPGWGDAESQAFNRAMLPAVESGRQFNTVLAAWRPGTPVPEQVHTVAHALSDAVANVASTFPDRPGKAELMTSLARAQGVVLTVLDLALTVGGGR